VTPIALRQIDEANVDGITGIAFTAGGLTSAASVLFLAPRVFKGRSLMRSLVISALLTGAAHLLLAASGTVPLYVTAFALISLLQAAMVPACNTLIASNVSRGRRGTAFGIASSAQAVSFMVGPLFATVFTALSLHLGFIVLGGVFAALAALLAVAMREPEVEKQRIN
jgi:MFS family permease